MKTIEDLAFSDLRLCMLDYGEFVPGALASSSDAALAALGAKTDLTPHLKGLDYNGEEACVERVLAGTHAHTETYSYAKLIYSDLGHGASVYAMKPQLYEGNLAFFFRRKTPWKDKFNDGIKRLVESGLVQKWYNEIMKEKTAAVTSGPSGLTSLAVAHLQGPFILLALGLLLALLAFAAEIVSNGIGHRAKGSLEGGGRGSGEALVDRRLGDIEA
ncbi:uncharacterized protein LOC125028561 [Penaeus chinensis]|uniref:uncharacterized protein LOC125028561 n=1 Tax=Penaeus chinensis TaxID=139456 RepID=UPI001FB57E79|nr:uncharacterized protein LOC125028561 [Penaeus chinensis]